MRGQTSMAVCRGHMRVGFRVGQVRCCLAAAQRHVPGQGARTRKGGRVLCCTAQVVHQLNSVSSFCRDRF